MNENENTIRLGSSTMAGARQTAVRESSLYIISTPAALSFCQLSRSRADFSFFIDVGFSATHKSLLEKQTDKAPAFIKSTEASLIFAFPSPPLDSRGESERGKPSNCFYAVRNAIVVAAPALFPFFLFALCPPSRKQIQLVG
jgi:hypothetical protein